MAEASVESMPQTKCEVKNVSTAQAAVNNVTRAQAATKDMPQVQAQVVPSIEEKNRDNNREKLPNMPEEKVLSREELTSEIILNLSENNFNKLEENLKVMKSTRVSIAVIGSLEVGKSSFINKMLGLDEDDEGAAEVGSGGTTRTLKVYYHPKIRQLLLSDLPGYGSLDLRKTDIYLEEIEAERHDFFLILYFPTITGDHKLILQKLIDMGKKFALIRTRADDMIRSNGHFSQQRMQEIKEKSRENLREFGFQEEVEIFVISNKNVQIGEFYELYDFIEKNMVRIKREATTHYVHAKTEEVIKQKEKLLIKRAWTAAVTMGIASININMLVDEIDFFLSCFGLNCDVLEKCPSEFTKQLETVFEIHNKGVQNFIHSNIAEANVLVANPFIQVVMEGFLPFIGPIITGTAAYKFYYNFLSNLIKRLATDARTLRKLQVNSMMKKE